MLQRTSSSSSSSSLVQSPDAGYFVLHEDAPESVIGTLLDLGDCLYRRMHHDEATNSAFYDVVLTIKERYKDCWHEGATAFDSAAAAFDMVDEMVVPLMEHLQKCHPNIVEIVCYVIHYFQTCTPSVSVGFMAAWYNVSLFDGISACLSRVVSTAKRQQKRLAVTEMGLLRETLTLINVLLNDVPNHNHTLVHLLNNLRVQDHVGTVKLSRPQKQTRFVVKFFVRSIKVANVRYLRETNGQYARFLVRAFEDQLIYNKYSEAALFCTSSTTLLPTGAHPVQPQQQQQTSSKEHDSGGGEHGGDIYDTLLLLFRNWWRNDPHVNGMLSDIFVKLAHTPDMQYQFYWFDSWRLKQSSPTSGTLSGQKGTSSGTTLLSQSDSPANQTSSMMDILIELWLRKNHRLKTSPGLLSQRDAYADKVLDYVNAAPPSEATKPTDDKLLFFANLRLFDEMLYNIIAIKETMHRIAIIDSVGAKT